MSGMFGAIDNARSGLGVYRQWLDAVSDTHRNYPEKVLEKRDPDCPQRAVVDMNHVA